MDETDFSLLKQGDAQAFEVLVATFEGPLFRFFLYTSGDHHLAQEQSAETFAQLVKSLTNMTGGCDQLRAFVFAVARNVQRRHWRRARNDRAPLSMAFDKSDGRPSPEACASDREQLGLAIQAIQSLDEPVRSVMVLRFIEQCTLGEIAAALEMPLGTVKSHVHRGRARLSDIFTGKGY